MDGGDTDDRDRGVACVERPFRHPLEVRILDSATESLEIAQFISEAGATAAKAEWPAARAAAAAPAAVNAAHKGAAPGDAAAFTAAAAAAARGHKESTTADTRAVAAACSANACAY